MGCKQRKPCPERGHTWTWISTSQFSAALLSILLTL